MANLGATSASKIHSCRGILRPIFLPNPIAKHRVGRSNSTPGPILLPNPMAFWLWVGWHRRLVAQTALQCLFSCPTPSQNTGLVAQTALQGRFPCPTPWHPHSSLSQQSPTAASDSNPAQLPHHTEPYPNDTANKGTNRISNKINKGMMITEIIVKILNRLQYLVTAM